ncbi:hypothetical protein EYC84_010991 [Monilinia fructicola]|uniref:Uncharacterized protein n=1 Tax=Monilinia fructicola TaxID=38448 RepID=A0A5M9JC81_MONFR|nr:hypothetical protein EYC84_010991 [Monilinia fructicola]
MHTQKRTLNRHLTCDLPDMHRAMQQGLFPPFQLAKLGVARWTPHFIRTHGFLSAYFKRPRSAEYEDGNCNVIVRRDGFHLSSTDSHVRPPLLPSFLPSQRAPKERDPYAVKPYNYPLNYYTGHQEHPSIYSPTRKHRLLGRIPRVAYCTFDSQIPQIAHRRRLQPIVFPTTVADCLMPRAR